MATHGAMMLALMRGKPGRNNRAVKRDIDALNIEDVVSELSQASDEESVNEATEESARGWQTVPKKKKNRGGKGKGGNGAAGRKAAPARNNGQMLVGQVEAVAAMEARGAPPQQQQQQQQ